MNLHSFNIDVTSLRCHWDVSPIETPSTLILWSPVFRLVVHWCLCHWSNLGVHIDTFALCALLPTCFRYLAVVLSQLMMFYYLWPSSLASFGSSQILFWFALKSDRKRWNLSKTWHAPLTLKHLRANLSSFTQSYVTEVGPASLYTGFQMLNRNKCLTIIQYAWYIRISFIQL